MFSARYQGLRIVATASAARELLEEGKTLHFVLKILCEGHAAPRKRKERIIENWWNKKNKTYNAVIVHEYDYYEKEHIWLLIHFGKFTRK